MLAWAAGSGVEAVRCPAWALILCHWQLAMATRARFLSWETL